MRMPSVKAIEAGPSHGSMSAGVVLVERLLLLAHRLVAAPRLGDHHHHRVGERAAGQGEQLQHVVEHRRVAAALVDDGQDLLQVVAEQAASEKRLSRACIQLMLPRRVLISPLWADVAVRVGAGPVGEGVGAEARVHHGQGGLHAAVARCRGSRRAAGARSASPCRRASGARSSGRRTSPCPRCRPRPPPSRRGGGGRRAGARRRRRPRWRRAAPTKTWRMAGSRRHRGGPERARCRWAGRASRGRAALLRGQARPDRLAVARGPSASRGRKTMPAP